ncbi:hypothetical protein BN946_scf184915.g19 [Trametes cinnabarina]|uniref:Cytochrome P450 n=1 Tax=Pycnoporus cinnabarinus TaxID=5643 RepID=A0A060SBE3_PYCCI|nr:hypothetical protein BN946_scf184915.g19 [Trametes cinnabarina]
MLIANTEFGIIAHVRQSASLWLFLGAFILCLLYVRSLVTWKKRMRGLSLPPGPKPLPLVGNILDIGRWENQWTGYKRLCSQYGDMVYLSLLGRRVLILGSPHAVEEVLEKRSSNTSDRPYSPLIPLTGNDAGLASMPYGQRWRDHRRAFWQAFQPRVVPTYRDVQRTSVRHFLHRVLSSDEDLQGHIRYVFASTMLKVLYNLDAAEKDDSMIGLIDKSLTCSVDLLTGGHILDFFPWLRYLPGWLPGAGFQRTLSECKATVDATKEVPFVKMKAALSQNDAVTSALAPLLAKAEEGQTETAKGDYEEIVKNVGLIAIQGGSDTSFSTLLGLFLAMSLYPEVQSKAQAELDAVVGRHRLPDFEDRESLVYINAVIKECLRWHTVLPLSLPHRTVDDDEIGGYFIPGGTIVIPNTWAILHDEQAYDAPYAFKPERFIREGKLDPFARDPAAYAFGYGRRVCAGRHFADESLFLTIASVLHVFRINAPLDEQGQPIKVDYRHTPGIVSYVVTSQFPDAMMTDHKLLDTRKTLDA